MRVADARDLLAAGWNELSGQATKLPRADLVQLINLEHATHKRKYVLRRLLGILRKRQLEDDILVLKAGRLPDWVNA